MFNEQGFRSFSFAALARETSLSRATLYNHLTNRDNLIYQCFQKSVAADSRRLEVANRENGSLNKVLQYVRQCFSEETQDEVAIIDTAVLLEENRKHIDSQIRANYDVLKQILDDGTKAGDIRECDTLLLSRAIPSMTTFARTSDRWLTDKFAKNADVIVDFLHMGTAKDRSYSFEFHKNADSFSRLTVAGFGKQQMADMRIEQILMTGSQLMNQRGMDNVSLEDVAEALEATRGSVYHYLKGREDLVTQCLNRGFDLYEEFFNYADAHGKSGLEKASIGSHLNTQAQVGTLQPTLAWMSFDVPSEKLREKLALRMRNLSLRAREFSLQGIKDGSRRDFDVAVPAVIRAGAYLWIPKWIDHITEPDQQHIADEIVALFNKGLAPLA